MLFEKLEDAFEFIRSINEKVGSTINEYKIEWWSWDSKWSVKFSGESARDHAFNYVEE